MLATPEFMSVLEAAQEMYVHKVVEYWALSVSGADEVLSFTNALKHLHARRLYLRAGFVYLMNDPILKRFWGLFTLPKAC